jgi:inositol oxygenase
MNALKATVVSSGIESLSEIGSTDVRIEKEEASDKKSEAIAKGNYNGDEFRNYESSARQSIVENHYRLMRQNQTVDFVERMYAKYHKFDHAEMTIAEGFMHLEDYVDSSDPDADFPNLEHCLQTAEGIRAAGQPDWFQLVGLLHDMGKMMFLWGQPEDGQEGTADGQQWSLGGDTWIVGCAIPETCVFPEFNHTNKDMKDDRYNTKSGMYKAGCGFKNVLFAYGHDEYMYRMLVHNKTLIPKEGLAMIRYHSCYPWHTAGEYREFMDAEDHELLPWVLEFNKFDLYTKGDQRPNVEALWPYYQTLIDKYCPGKLHW